jgi:hypothetical protein
MAVEKYPPKFDADAASSSVQLVVGTGAPP